jgi:hypothetical protein
MYFCISVVLWSAAARRQPFCSTNVSEDFRSEMGTAAMADTKILSFMTKFLNLWNTGRSTTLAFKYNAGKASINLRLEIGHHHDQEHPQR